MIAKIFGRLGVRSILRGLFSVALYNSNAIVESKQAFIYLFWKIKLSIETDCF